MTRINLIPPVELADQHLFAEFREIKMIPASLLRSLRAAWQKEFDKNDSNKFSEERERLAIEAVLKRIPSNFTLNTGHVSFFYNKGAYLTERYSQIREELEKRGIRFNRESGLDSTGLIKLAPWNGNYIPTQEALAIIRTRIAEKISMKPNWYRYYGKQGVPSWT